MSAWEFRVTCDCGWVGAKAEFAKHECRRTGASPFDDPGLIALIVGLVALVLIASLVRS